MPSLRALLPSCVSFFRRHVREVLIIVVVVYLPIELVMATLPFDDEHFGRSLVRQIRTQRLLEMFLGVIATMAIAQLVLADREGRALSAGDSLWLAASRWRASVGTEIILNLFFVLALLALVLPLFFVWIATLFTIPLVALRKLSGMKAIKASWALVRGRWWAVFRLMLLLSGIEILALLIIVVPFVFLPEHYTLSVLSSLIADAVGSFFVVAVVQLMLTLETVPLRQEPLTAAEMYPAT